MLTLLNPSQDPQDGGANGYLNFGTVAATVAEIIENAHDRPVSIGVSGAWGVGKSSLIRLVRAAIEETSQSSKGSPSGVPMVPPWVPDLPLPPPLNPPVPQEGAPPDTGDPDSAPAPAAPREPVPLAPAGRFRATNVNLGEWARTGDRGQLRRGMGHYVAKGYGGSSTGTRRMASTAQTANALFTALGGGAANSFATPGAPLDPALTASMSADEIMDAVVEAVRPVDGTQDSEANRAAIMDALSDVLTEFPDADLRNLLPEQREVVLCGLVIAPHLEPLGVVWTAPLHAE